MTKAVNGQVVPSQKLPATGSPSVLTEQLSMTLLQVMFNLSVLYIGFTLVLQHKIIPLDQSCLNNVTSLIETYINAKIHSFYIQKHNIKIAARNWKMGMIETI